MLKNLLLICCCLSSILTHFAFADRKEEVLGFHSSITINEDGSADVTEVLSVYAGGDKLRHGIERILPAGNYQINKILLNNNPVYFATKYVKDHIHLQIGNSEVTLPNDIYIFTLIYHANNVIRFLSNRDEFTWDVTGHNWSIPILKLQIDFKMPENAAWKTFRASFGPDKAFVINQINSDHLTFITNRVLFPFESLSFSVDMPKQVIQTYSFLNNQVTRLHYIQIILWQLLILTVLYYGVMLWLKQQRSKMEFIVNDIVLSPAVCRYLLLKRFDIKTLTSTLMHLISKGYIAFGKHPHEIILQKQPLSLANLPLEEKHLITALFKENNSVTLNTQSPGLIKKAFRTLHYTLYENYQKKFTNHLYTIPGWIFGCFAFITTYLATNNRENIFLLSWIFFWTIAIGYFLQFTVQKFGQIRKRFNFTRLAKLIFFSIMALFFFCVEVIVLILIDNHFPNYTLYLAMSILIINLFFQMFISLPTSQGKKWYDEMHLFRHFLSQDFYENPASETKKYLPYAIAFDIEHMLLATTSSENPKNQDVFYLAKIHNLLQQTISNIFRAKE